MRDWKAFWNSIDTQQGKNNDWSSMMAQVGKTIQQKPIDSSQFKMVYEKIVTTLSLEKDDIVLDLCCGNGIVTAKISDYVKSVFGVDFSQPLIDIAKATSPNNINYFCCSVLDDFLVELLGNHKFKKIYMNTGLQHFVEHDFAKLLDNFLLLSDSTSTLFITDIPEKKNLFSFYNTEERREDYYKRIANGTEAIGTWWEREFLIEVVTNKGLFIKTLEQAVDLHTAHYRFDIIIYRK